MVDTKALKGHLRALRIKAHDPFILYQEKSISKGLLLDYIVADVERFLKQSPTSSKADIKWFNSLG